MNLCVDCKFCKRSLFYEASLSVCVAPQNGKDDPITGKRIPRYKWCTAQRVCDAEGTCGMAGAWFQPRARRWWHLARVLKVEEA